MTSELLKGKVISIAGLVYDTNSLLLSHNSLRKQITDAGGEWSPTVGKSCTHLVASRREYEKRSKKVQRAEQIQGLKIVHPDWLLVSLESKVQDDGQYLHSESTTTNANGKRPGSPVPTSDGIASTTKKDPTSPGLSKDTQAISNITRKIPPEPACPYQESHRVYISGDGTVYDASFNLTISRTNGNRFLLIQVLQDVATNEAFLVWQRWGRVGEKGQSHCLDFGKNTTKALRKFKHVFHKKTGSKWEDRLSSWEGEYTYVEKRYDEFDIEKVEGGKSIGPNERKRHKSEKQDEPAIEPPKSQLHPEVQFLIRFIFNPQIFEDMLASMSYDAKELPLRNLSKRMLLRGFELLKRLGEVIANETSPQHKIQQCSDLSDKYFSTIPHAFGWRKPPIIVYAGILRKEIELLENLSDMEVATEIMEVASRAIDREEHILDLHYKGLNLNELTPLNPDSTEYTELETYLLGSFGSTHNIQYGLRHIFRVSRAGEEERYKDSPFAGKSETTRLLLWHGSRSTNCASILYHGLRIDPAGAQFGGKLFGNGVYFADCSTKSANYCRAHMSNSLGILLLCEVDVGALPMYERVAADYGAAQNSRAAGKTTTLGRGRCFPSEWKDAGCLDEKLKGVWMPDYTTGTLLQIPGPYGNCVEYNEYVAYDARQIRVRYLLLTEM